MKPSKIGDIVHYYRNSTLKPVAAIIVDIQEKYKLFIMTYNGGYGFEDANYSTKPYVGCWSWPEDAEDQSVIDRKKFNKSQESHPDKCPIPNCNCHLRKDDDAEEKPKECEPLSYGELKKGNPACQHDYECRWDEGVQKYTEKCKKCYHTYYFPSAPEKNKAEELIDKIDNVLEGTRTNMCDKLYHIINLIQEYKQEKVNQYK